MKIFFRAPLAPPYVWLVAIDPWKLSGPRGRGGGGESRTRTEETPPPPVVRAEPLDHRTTAGLETGEACQRTSHRRSSKSEGGGLLVVVEGGVWEVRGRFLR